MNRHAVSNPDVTLSKTLSWLLRHGAVKEGLHLTSEGFIRVDEILQHKNLRGKYTVADVERVVSSNDKQRFALRKSANGVLEIRANQGHSLPSADLDLKPITKGIGDVIHGTYFRWLPNIKREGLSRMRRNHIHFATGLPTDGTVVSGARSSAEVFIYIDLEKALTDGIKFYKSANGVIVTPGNSGGYLEPKYFKKICTKNGNLL